MLKPGDEIDIWVVDRALGQGGMGSVYRCHNREAKRILAAVKVLDASLGRQPNAKARFVREAEILFTLDHPGIVKVRNIRMDLAMPYLEMEFIDGVSLETRIRSGPTAVEEALPLLRQVAEAIAYLHRRGIRHRDIKPSNLVIQPSGTIKLVDFGIATEADGATLTQHGQTFGSVSYAPPEWLEPAELDAARWDIYAAGVVFYELLTGVEAFPVADFGTMQQQVLRMMTVKQRHPPLDPGTRVPRALRALIRDMTHPNWRERVQDAESLRARLATVDIEDFDPTEPAAAPGSGWTTATVGEPRAPAGATMVPDLMLGDGPPPPAARGPAPPPRAPLPPRASDTRMGLDDTLVARPRSRTRAVAALGGLVLLAAAGLLGSRALAPSPTRDVVVQVTGLPPGVPFALRLGDRAPDTAAGDRVTFAAVAPGALALRAAVGQGCAAEPTDPVWCASSVTPLAVEPGAEPFAYTLPLAPPALRPLRVALAGLPADATPAARIGDRDGKGDASGVTLPDVPPGAHTVTVHLGTCPDDAAGCATAGTLASCPAGCSSWRGEVVVPAGDGVFETAVTLPPLPARSAAATRGDAEEGRPARGGSVVTASAYSRWLSRRPEWQPDAARAAGKADAGYLSGWDGINPPAGKAGLPVVGVSWSAANAYCASRGGLLGVDEEPLTWDDSPQRPWHEFRTDGGRPAWRRSDGATSPAVVPTESGAFIGFRCAR